jgi:hypothetical protein
MRKLLEITPADNLAHFVAVNGTLIAQHYQSGEKAKLEQAFGTSSPW